MVSTATTVAPREANRFASVEPTFPAAPATMMTYLLNMPYVPICE
jgi:hypothetical protein